MATHNAVATVSIKGPLALIRVPTISPGPSEIRIRVEWTASTPLDLHQNDGGLLVTHPQVLGDGISGTVVEVGDQVQRLAIGDQVFGFAWREQKEKAHQEFCTAPEYLFGKVPENVTLAQAVTLPNNFVTAWHSLTTYLDISLPWPRPENYVPLTGRDTAILIWGGSSSVGQYALQILRYYGYRNIIATASPKHHERLRTLGATRLFDYNDANVAEQILCTIPNGEHTNNRIPLILDCIGSLNGSMVPLSKIAKTGTKVAVLLPIIVRDSTETENPIYAMDVNEVVRWEDGAVAMGVRTHHYLENEFHKRHLQPDIMPTLLGSGAVIPNNIKIIEGETLLERAQKALDALRRKEASGERLVWRIADQ